MLRLENATYLVRDLDDALTFFVDALGFTLRQDETFEGGWRRVVVSPARRRVGSRSGPRARGLRRRPRTRRSPGG
ncbi:VOC family protein [Oerskovia sp. M15]